MSGFSLKTAESTRKVASTKHRASSSQKQEIEPRLKMPRCLLVVQSAAAGPCPMLNARYSMLGPTSAEPGVPSDPSLHRLLSCV
jgi:hypothetical protein